MYKQVRQVLTLRQLLPLVAVVVLMPFWTINFEEWLKAKGLDRVLIEADKAVTKPDFWDASLIWLDAAFRFANNEYVIGGVVAVLIFAFAPVPLRLWRYFQGRTRQPKRHEGVGTRSNESTRLAAVEIESALAVLIDIDSFLATEVADVIHQGKIIGNWRKTLKSDGNKALIDQLYAILAKKDAVANGLNGLVDRHSYHLVLLNIKFDEIGQALIRWHSPASDLIKIAKLIPKLPSSELGEFLNPKVSVFSEAVGETRNLVTTKRDEIKAIRQRINPT